MKAPCYPDSSAPGQTAAAQGREPGRRVRLQGQARSAWSTGQLRDRGRRRRRHRRRIRLGQVDHVAVDHAASSPEPPGRIVAGPGRVRRHQPAGPAALEHAGYPRPRHRDDLPGADELAQPGDDDRRPDRRGDHAAREAGRAERRDARDRAARSSSAFPIRRAGWAPIRTSSPAACASA